MKKECIYDERVKCPVQEKIDKPLIEILEKACPYCWKLKLMAYRPLPKAIGNYYPVQNVAESFSELTGTAKNVTTASA